MSNLKIFFTKIIIISYVFMQLATPALAASKSYNNIPMLPKDSGFMPLRIWIIAISEAMMYNRLDRKENRSAIINK